MKKKSFSPSILLLALPLFLVFGCGALTDAATRLADDLEDGASQLGREEGATVTVEHRTPSHPGQCTGPYAVQFDEAGALIVWCKDAAGETVSSHSTSHHSRYVDAPRTWVVEKAAGATLYVDLERRGGHAVITAVR